MADLALARSALSRRHARASLLGCARYALGLDFNDRPVHWFARAIAAHHSHS